MEIRNSNTSLFWNGIGLKSQYVMITVTSYKATKTETNGLVRIFL